MTTPTEQLLLRGMHLVMRASFSPNEPTASAKHFAGITQDLAPWFKDYADEIAKPTLPEAPQLGLTTTRQLLDELRARTEVHVKAGADYRIAHDWINALAGFIEGRVDGGLDYRTVE